MSLRHDLVEVLRLDGVKRRQPEVVNNEKIGTHVFLQLPLPRVVHPRRIETAEHLRRFDEERRVSPPARLVSQCLCEMRLPGTRKSVDEDMLLFLDKEAGCEVGHGTSSDPGIEGKVEPFERLLFFERCLPDTLCGLLRLPAFYLVLDDKGEEGEVRQVLALRLGEP